MRVWAEPRKNKKSGPDPDENSRRPQSCGKSLKKSSTPEIRIRTRSCPRQYFLKKPRSGLNGWSFLVKTSSVHGIHYMHYIQADKQTYIIYTHTWHSHIHTHMHTLHT